MNRLVSILALGLVLCAVPCLSDDLAQAGRDIVAKNQGAAVTLMIVGKMTATGESSSPEMKMEAPGMIVDPSGLVVTSFSSTDLAEFLSSAMSESMRGDMKFSTEITSLIILTADGTELPAKIVLRDKDLDLAFIRPVKKPVTPMPFVDLSKSSSPKLLDRILSLTRTGVVANRALAADSDEIRAIIEKPRTLYVISDGAMSELGAPVFAYADGNIVGIVTLRMKMKGGASSRTYGFGNPGILAVILPAADIAEAAKQAPENAVEEKPTPPAAKPTTPAKPATPTKPKPKPKTK